MSDKKLLPCPFCGGEAILQRWRRTYGYYVICKKCGCRTPVYQYQYDSKEKRREYAINTWNNRQPMKKIVGRLEELEVEYMYPDDDDYIVGEYDGIREALTVVLEEGGLND